MWLALVLAAVLSAAAAPTASAEIPPPGAMACHQAHPNDPAGIRACEAKRITGMHMTKEAHDCLVAAGVISGIVVTGGLISGVAARAMVGAAWTAGAMACFETIRD